MQASEALQGVRSMLEPEMHVRQRAWHHVLRGIAPVRSTAALGQLQDLLMPASSAFSRIRMHLLGRLAPVAVHPSRHISRPVSWVAAFALLAFVVRLSPALFLAPQTVAESSVTLLPTGGTVSVLVRGLWQPIHSETTIIDAAQLRTGPEGGATIILHDDGNMRLDEDTAITLVDLVDRPQARSSDDALRLSSGRLWLQGLLPASVHGITVATPHGDVTVHGGSVSIAVGTVADIRVWDRKVRIEHAGREMTLVAGERTELWADNVPRITRIDAEGYDDPWVAENLRRDAAHRREIAQMQQERRARRAGILPTSPLYSVKRAAEQMDVLLTFDAETKVQKRLQQASTRLSEAAALLQQGASGAILSLEEYKQTLLSLASGSGANGLTEGLLRQEVAENVAEFSASLPSDGSYLLKQAVLETTAVIAEAGSGSLSVEGMVLEDMVGALRQAVQEKNADHIAMLAGAIRPRLEQLTASGAVQDDGLDEELRKEIASVLSSFDPSIAENADGSGALLDAVADLLPGTAAPAVGRSGATLPMAEARPSIVVEPLTDEQIAALTSRIRKRILVYSMQRPRWNQLQMELKELAGHPDEGRILRALYRALEEDGLSPYVRPAFRELRQRLDDAGL